MFSRDELEHDHFEELCALAPIGEVSSEELHALRSHLAVCAKCRMAHEDYSDIVGGTFAQATDLREFDYPPVSAVEPDTGERERFFSEARRRGFHFSRQAGPGSEVIKAQQPLKLPPFARTESWYRAALAAMVLVVATASVLGGYQLGKVRYNRAPEATERSQPNDEIRQTVAGTPAGDTPVPARSPALTAASQFGVAVAELPESAKEIGRLEAGLRSAEDERLALQAGSKSLEDQLQAATTQIKALQSETESGKGSTQSLTAKLEETQRSLAQALAELHSLTDVRSHDASIIAALDARNKELSEMLRDKAEKLERATSLLGANRDIRDLMTARNLHIVDVYEVDGKGKTQRTFGRAFYTEGKSLIFYAYDPIGRRADSEFALQGWGTRGASNIAQSLGIFYIDDQKANRWVLEFNDPRVLAEIDSVFVTLEPPGGSKKPTGERLLYAYLKNRANHP
jgi:hypothetical protein